MLRSLKEIIGYTLQETDDVIGSCKDFLFDDVQWNIRYMVADTGTWLAQHKVLITPNALGSPDWQSELIPVSQTRNEIENCPPLDSHAPVSRAYEETYHEHFGLPFYWIGADFTEGMIAKGGIIQPVADLPEEDAPTETEGNNEDIHLRSSQEIMSYGVMARDQQAGRIDDIIIDDSNWEIKHFVVNTGAVLPDKLVLVEPNEVTLIDWSNQQVSIDMSANILQERESFDPDEPVNRQQEVRLYDYYGRPKGWETST